MSQDKGPGYVKMTRDEAGDELIAANPLAFILATVIARRARWSDGFNRHNLSPGEALIGDWRDFGMSEQQYRTAKAQLDKWNFATFKPTNKGTIAKLTDTRLFDVLASSRNGQGNTPATTEPPPANNPATTNEEREEGKNCQERKDKTPAAGAAECLQVYEAYPRKVAKPAALKAIAKSLQGTPCNELLTKVKAFAAHHATLGTAEQYIPHPATYFNQQRYNDALPQTTAQAQTRCQAAPVVESITIDGHVYTDKHDPKLSDFNGDESRFVDARSRYNQWAIRNCY